MQIEKLINQLKTEIEVAMSSFRSGDPVDPGVWNDSAMPENPRSYLQAACPFNILALIRHLEFVMKAMDDQADEMIRNSMQSALVVNEIVLMLDEFTDGIVSPDEGAAKDVRNRVRDILRRLAKAEGKEIVEL